MFCTKIGKVWNVVDFPEKGTIIQGRTNILKKVYPNGIL